MLNLIKSDLYRITRPQGLHGSLWQYGLAMLLIYIAVAALMIFAKTQTYAELSGGTDAGAAFDVSSYTVYLASMLSAVVPLCSCFLTAEHGLQEFKNGYARTILSSRAGRLSYFAGKIVFAGVVAAIVVLFAIAISTAGALVGRFTFGAVEGPLEILGWIAGFWLNTWALAVLSLILVYATRVSPVSYIGAFIFCNGAIPASLTGLVYAGDVFPALGPVFEPLRPVVETLAAWVPSTALNNLNAGARLFFMSPADIWGPTSQALTCNPGVQALLTGIIWIILATTLVLAIARKRDI